MATYSTENHERIAVAIGQDVRDVAEHKRLFEWAADWYGLDRGLPRDAPPWPRRIPPSKMRGRWGSSGKRPDKTRVQARCFAVTVTEDVDPQTPPERFLRCACEFDKESSLP
jgi:hypothetical protein